MSSQMHVLVVDDEPVIRSLFTDFLKDEGYVVETVGNGKEALDRLSQKTFGIIFMDVHMPVMNGLEALIEMRRLYPSLAVVMMDSFPDKLAEEAQKKGAITCIHKPFNITEITGLIKANSKSKED